MLNAKLLSNSEQAPPGTPQKTRNNCYFASRHILGFALEVDIDIPYWLKQEIKELQSFHTTTSDTAKVVLSLYFNMDLN